MQTKLNLAKSVLSLWRDSDSGLRSCKSWHSYVHDLCACGPARNVNSIGCTSSVALMGPQFFTTRGCRMISSITVMSSTSPHTVCPLPH